MPMEINEKIKLRRKKNGLTDLEVAAQVGLTIHEYCDVEWHPDEIFTVTELREVKKLCEVLQLEFLDLFDMVCAFCDESKPFPQEYLLPRNELLRTTRTRIGLSAEELGDRIGFEEVAIIQMERDPDYLETWSIDLIKALSNETGVPLQVLLNVKCRKCRR